jgi:hypothetical protein
VPIEEIIHESLAERVNYELTQKSRYTEEEKMLSGKFFEKLNSWLETIRKTKISKCRGLAPPEWSGGKTLPGK